MLHLSIVDVECVLTGHVKRSKESKQLIQEVVSLKIADVKILLKTDNVGSNAHNFAKHKWIGTKLVLHLYVMLVDSRTIIMSISESVLTKGSNN